MSTNILLTNTNLYLCKQIQKQTLVFASCIKRDVSIQTYHIDLLMKGPSSGHFLYSPISDILPSKILLDILKPATENSYQHNNKFRISDE